jgi:hypothetical protein
MEKTLKRKKNSLKAQTTPDASFGPLPPALDLPVVPLKAQTMPDASFGPVLLIPVHPIPLCCYTGSLFYISLVEEKRKEKKTGFEMHLLRLKRPCRCCF